MKRKLAVLLCILTVVSITAGCGCGNSDDAAQTASAAVSSEPAEEAVSEPTETATPTPKPTETATPTPKPTKTPTPAPKPTGTATPTLKPTETATPAPIQVPAPKITADPTDETVEEGGSCLYIAKADNAKSMIWHFVSPEGKTDIAYNAIGSYFPKLTVNGGESENLTLSTIPLDFNGWKAYCEFINDGGKTKSGTAVTTVKAKPTDTPAPTPTPTPTEEPAPEPTEEPAPDPGEDPYIGIFYEENAGRGEMVISDGPGNTYEVKVTWSSSASEVTQWTFSGEFNGRALMKYKNCRRVDITFNEDGTEVSKEVYTDGKGQIQMTDEGVIWADRHKENGEEVNFIRN